MYAVTRRLHSLTIPFGYSGMEDSNMRERVDQMFFEYQEETVL